jgi:hypothetical protein
VFGPPTAVIAVQWHTRLRCYNDMRLTYAVGASSFPPPVEHAGAAAAGNRPRGVRQALPAVTPRFAKARRSAGFHADPRHASHRGNAGIARRFEQVAATALQNIQARFSRRSVGTAPEMLQDIRQP